MSTIILTIMYFFGSVQYPEKKEKKIITEWCKIARSTAHFILGS